MTRLDEMNIDKDFFCGCGAACTDATRQYCQKPGRCKSLRRKWPTPEQFKEEYGVEYSDDSPVWVYSTVSGWSMFSYKDTKDITQPRAWHRIYTVCACTPYGKPADVWRPEEEEDKNDGT